MDKLKTDWIRAAVSGATVDGREITDQQIEDMAVTYSQETYTAHIWPEHIRGVVPEGVFRSLGDVVAVKAARIKGGALDGRLGLYVILEPHPDLIAMVRNGQKVHLSIEMNPDFAATGKAYLMGLGVTDSPASLGTGLMKFSTESRKQSVFSEPLLCDMGSCQPGKGDDLKLIRAMLEKLTAQPSTPAQTFASKADFEKLAEVVEGLRLEIVKYGEMEVINHGPRPEVTGAYPFDSRDIGY